MAKNTGNEKSFTSDATEFSESQQTAFPPYWNPKEGESFIAQVIGMDNSDPNFIRWQLMNASKDVLHCQQGPADDAEAVEVQPGEFFSCSSYAALPLGKYIGEKVMVTAMKKRSLKAGREMWIFDLKVSKETAKRVMEAQRRAVAAMPPALRQNNDAEA